MGKSTHTKEVAREILAKVSASLDESGATEAEVRQLLQKHAAMDYQEYGILEDDLWLGTDKLFSGKGCDNRVTFMLQTDDDACIVYDVCCLWFHVWDRRERRHVLSMTEPVCHVDDFTTEKVRQALARLKKRLYTES